MAADGQPLLSENEPPCALSSSAETRLRQYQPQRIEEYAGACADFDVAADCCQKVRARGMP